MHLEIILTGLMALAVWGWVWRRSLKGPLSWCSPTALFAAGIMVIYIVPSLYWQSRPWPYYVPPYFEGIPLVMVGAFILGLPFVFDDLVKRGQIRPRVQIAAARPGDFNQLLWCLVIPVFLGMALRIYLLGIGWQARLAREVFTIAGSASLGLIVMNIIAYYPVCYFGLTAFGTRDQRAVGKTFWVLDGGLMLWTLHRYELLTYLLHSLVFLKLQGWRPKARHGLLGGCAIVLILVVIGQVPQLTVEKLSSQQVYLDPLQTLDVVVEAFRTISRGDELFGMQGHLLAENPVSRTLDDAMFRLYDARSAAAVMSNVLETIPYFYGETFLHILYVFVPRYFWENKPQLDEIHKITTWVMPGDMGINPLGTIGEFYVNFGFSGVLLGGLVYLILFRVLENHLTKRKLGPAWLCGYPMMSQWIFHVSTNFTRQVCEGLRTLLVIGMIALIFWVAARPRRETPPQVPLGEEDI